MKNFFLALAFMLIGTFGFANNQDDFKGEISLETTSSEEVTSVTLSFDSKADFYNFNVNEIVDFENENEYCTVDITVTASVGFSSTKVEVSMTAKDIPCDKVKETVTKLKKAATDGLEAKLN